MEQPVLRKIAEVKSICRCRAFSFVAFTSAASFHPTSSNSVVLEAEHVKS